MTPHDRRLLVATTLSGVFSYAGTLILDKIPGGVALFRNSGVYLAGVLFGVLVLAPRASGGGRRILKQALLVVLSTVIYYAAVKLAMYQAVTLHMREMIACGMSGALGALAVGAAARAVLSTDVPSRRFAEAAAIGAATGTLFGVNGTFRIPDAVQALILVLGFTAWQTGVALALFRSKE